MVTKKQHNSSPKVSVIISTYNWTEALYVVVRSFFVQTYPLHEIIIADDGSREDTRDMIELLRTQSPVPIVHVWQEDDGYRKAKITNKAIAKATGDYLVLVDGDCIVKRHFVADHLSIAKPNGFVCGRRILLTPEMSEKTLAAKRLIPWEGVLPPSFRIFSNTMRSRIIRKLFAKFYGKKGVSHALGCNLSFWRDDLIKVNGYNEAYEGWGAEDFDIIIRLLKCGVEKSCLKGGGAVYHLHHASFSTERLDINTKLLEEQMASTSYRAELGVDQYL